MTIEVDGLVYGEHMIRTMREELTNLRRAVEEYLPQPNGDKQQPGDPAAWNSAMFNLGKLKEQRDTLRADLERVTRERDAQMALAENLAQLVYADTKEAAEAIAVWFESLIEKRPNMYVSDFLTACEVAEKIRSGAWCKEPVR